MQPSCGLLEYLIGFFVFRLTQKVNQHTPEPVSSTALLFIFFGVVQYIACLFQYEVFVQCAIDAAVVVTASLHQPLRAGGVLGIFGIQHDEY